VEKNRLALVDYLKGISMAGIVIYHLLTVFWGITGTVALAASFAGAGIHLFNVCSGFGLGLSQLRTPLKTLAFFRRRFLKIYLPYILAVTLYLATSGFIFQTVQPIRDYLSHVFLYKMFREYRINSFGGHFWYISTILQFYILFLPLMLLHKRMGGRGFFLLCAAVSVLWTMAGRLLGVGELRVWSSCALHYLWEFALGICLAERCRERDTVMASPLPLWAVGAVSAVCLGIYGLTSLKGGLLQAYNDIFALASIFGIYYLLYQILPLRRIFVWVSSISFSWYLTHYLVFNAVFQLLPLGDVLCTAVSFPVSIVFAWGFQKLTERITGNV